MLSLLNLLNSRFVVHVSFVEDRGARGDGVLVVFLVSKHTVEGVRHA